MAALVRQQRQYILTPRCGRYEEHAVPGSLESQQGGGKPQRRAPKRFMSECPTPPQGWGKPTGRPQGLPCGLGRPIRGMAGATLAVALTLKSAPRGLWPPATLQRTSFRMLRRTNIVIRPTPITIRKTVPGS